MSKPDARCPHNEFKVFLDKYKGSFDRLKKELFHIGDIVDTKSSRTLKGALIDTSKIMLNLTVHLSELVPDLVSDLKNGQRGLTVEQRRFLVDAILSFFDAAFQELQELVPALKITTQDDDIYAHLRPIIEALVISLIKSMPTIRKWLCGCC